MPRDGWNCLTRCGSKSRQAAPCQRRGAGHHPAEGPNGFNYRDIHGELIAEMETLGRIKSLAIPPAWTDVWICPSPNGHIQATGRDARGRKQYRYHPRWRQTRDETKYGRMLVFSRALPRIRARVEADLRRHGLPREKVLAAIVRLLELTLIRIGNSEYSKSQQELWPDDAARPPRRRSRATKSASAFAARAASGTRASSPTAAWPASSRTAATCRATSCSSTSTRTATATPSIRPTSTSICARSSGEDITAKDFRTWAGTLLAAMALQEFAALDGDGRASRHRARRRAGRQASRQHRRRLPQMLHPPGDLRGLSRWHAGAHAGRAHARLSRSAISTG